MHWRFLRLHIGELVPKGAVTAEKIVAEISDRKKFSVLIANKISSGLGNFKTGGKIFK